MVHTLLDAARMGSAMATAKELNAGFRSLYKGRSEEQLADFAPYLFMISNNNSFSRWLTAEGWGHSWGIYLESLANPADVYRHFRKYLLVQNEQGKEYYFRFYDPRVMRSFLPTCNPQQLVDFFGPVTYFLLEDEDPAYALRFSLQSGHLQLKRIIRTEAQQLLIC